MLLHLAKLSPFARSLEVLESLEAFESVESISKAVALCVQSEPRLLSAANFEGRCRSSVRIADAVGDVRDCTYSTIVVIVDRIGHSESCSEPQNNK